MEKCLDESQRIVSDPEIRGGKARIRGTRITVQDVLEYLAAGMSVEEIVFDFPSITIEDVRACLGYAALRADHVAHLAA